MHMNREGLPESEKERKRERKREEEGERRRARWEDGARQREIQTRQNVK